MNLPPERPPPPPLGAIAPRITVCVPTRGRGAAIAPTLESLRRLDHDSFEVIIVDQSNDDGCRTAYQQVAAADPRFAFVRSAARGRSLACNAGLARARGAIIAFTDDDCEPPADWLSGMESALSRHSEVAMISGAVRAAPHDAQRYFAAELRIPRPRRHRSPWLAYRSTGVGGANQVFRTSVLRALGGFDPVLGVGAPFKASEDLDIFYRVLRAGHQVMELPSPAVLHRGMKAWDEMGRQRLWDYAESHGAVWMKHLRLGDPAALPDLILGWPLGAIHWDNVIRLRRPTGLYLVAALTRGAVSSFSHSIDRTTRRYIARAAEISQPSPGQR